MRSNNRKRTPGRCIQTIVCAPTIKRRNAIGKMVDVPNPDAGKLKQIKHWAANPTMLEGILDPG